METKTLDKSPEADFDEKNVGITEFLFEGQPLLVRYKYRYSDFIVNEIDRQGQVVQPPPKRDPNAKKIVEEVKQEESTTLEVKSEQEEAFRKILKGEDFQKLLKFFEEVNFSNYGKDLFVEMDSPEGKEARKIFHETVRSLGNRLDSETFDVNGRKMVKIFVLDKKQKKRRFDSRAYPDKYLEFTLHKTNFDSMGAIGLLAKFLAMKPNNFGIAGNKDKRGTTTQRVTVFRVLAEDLEKLQSRKKWVDNLSMGDYTYVPKQLKLGDLKGNRFALGLRLVEAADSQAIAKTVELLNEKGFINYYGLQRFGVTNIKTHVIGKEVLRKEWKNVVELILSAKDADFRADEAKRKFLQNYDCKEALKNIPHKNKVERILIEGLKFGGVTNFRNAFFCLPRFIREIYGHAFQSYIWNKTVSRRIAKYGKEPIVGDMVFAGSENEDIDEDVQENDVVIPLEQEEEEEEQGLRKDKKDSEMEEEEKKATIQRKKADPPAIIFVTEENKKNYTLHNLVIPLVGRDIPLPENNSITEIINEVLQEEGLTIESFIKSDQDIFFRGGYRKLAIKPEDIQWDIIKYNNSEQDIQNAYYFTEKDIEGESDGKFQAIRIKFNLPKSAYATMCLRELTKCSTSFNFQMKLNNMTIKS